MLLDREIVRFAERAVARRVTVCGLALAAAAALAGPRGCASCSVPAAGRPSLVWDGDGYSAAWAVREEGRVSVYVHRFAFERDPGDPQRAIRTDSLRGTPELVAGPDGLLLLAVRGDGALLSAPLDRDGRPRGEIHPIARHVEALCPAPAWSRDAYLAAWLSKDGDGAQLTLAAIDRTGAIVRSREAAVAAGSSCALGATDRVVAVVVTRGDERVLRVVAQKGGFAILLQRAGGVLRVVESDQRGRVVRRYDLDRAVRADSADLGASGRGLFVSWTDGSRAWIAGVAADGALTARWELRAGSRPSGVRALGRAGECAAAWTSLGGMVVHAALARDCPRERTSYLGGALSSSGFAAP